MKSNAIQNNSFNKSSQVDPIQLTFNSSLDYEPTVGISPNGTQLIVAWSSNRGGGMFKIWMKNSNDRGESWSDAKQITFGAFYADHYPDLVINSKGTAFLIWQSYSTSPSNIQIMNSTDGGETWSAPHELINKSYWPTKPHIAVDTTDTLFVIWTSDNYINNSIWVIRNNNSGMIWSNPVQLASPNSSAPFITCKSSNYCMIGWDSEVENTFWYRISIDQGQSWSHAEKLIEFQRNEDRIRDIQFDFNNDLILLCSWGYDFYFLWSDDNGKTWSSPYYPPNQTVYVGQINFLIGPDGTGLLVWEGIFSYIGNWEIWYIKTDSTIDPDDDSLSTFQELMLFHTDPFLIDSDGDGLSEEEEVRIYNTNPIDPDSDDDRFSDGIEIKWYTNPLFYLDNPLTRILVYALAIGILINLGFYWKWKKQLSLEKESVKNDWISIITTIPYLTLVAFIWLLNIASSGCGYHAWSFTCSGGHLALIGSFLLIPASLNTLLFVLAKDKTYELVAFAVALFGWIFLLIGITIGFYSATTIWERPDISYLIFISIHLIVGFILFRRRNFHEKKLSQRT